MRALTADEVAGILARALRDPERGLGSEAVHVEDSALRAIAVYANGDGERLRVGVADVLRCETDKTTGDVQRIFASLEHARQPVD